MLNSKNYMALGLMSGTSADGIDVATVITDGRSKIKLGPSGYHPFSKSFKNRIKSVFKEEVNIKNLKKKKKSLK